MRCALLLLLSTACAAPEQKPTWDTLPNERRTKVASAPDLHPEERARKAWSGTACERDAAKLYETNRLAAWDMMRECIRRDDFRDILLLGQHPWRQHMKDAPGLLQDLVRVAVRRNSEELATNLREIGLDVDMLDLNQLGIDNDKTQLFAARVAVIEKGPDGSYEVEEIVYERSLHDARFFRRDIQAPKRTGRFLHVKPGKCLLKRNSDAWLVGRFLGADMGDGRWPFRCEAAAILGPAPTDRLN